MCFPGGNSPGSSAARGQLSAKPAVLASDSLSGTQLSLSQSPISQIQDPLGRWVCPKTRILAEEVRNLRVFSYSCLHSTLPTASRGTPELVLRLGVTGCHQGWASPTVDVGGGFKALPFQDGWDGWVGKDTCYQSQQPLSWHQPSGRRAQAPQLVLGPHTYNKSQFLTIIKSELERWFRG